MPDPSDGNNSPTDPPSALVGSTHELIEQILLKLPAKRLFVLQQVNQQWQHTINRSHAIKKKKFLLPNSSPLDPTPELLQPPHTSDHWPQEDLRLSHLIPLRPCQDTSTGAVVKVEPFSARVWGWHGLNHIRELSTLSVCVHILFSGSKNEIPTWRSTLFTDPPIKTLPLMVGSKAPRHIKIGRHLVQREEGLRLGDIYDAHLAFKQDILEQCGVDVGSEHIIGSFYIRRPLPTNIDPSHRPFPVSKKFTEWCPVMATDD